MTAAHTRPVSFEVAIRAAKTGRPLTVLHANGYVAAAIADRKGGWFVGGSFTRIGGRREIALAHLLPDGRVDPRWRARVGSASRRPVAVNVLALGTGGSTWRGRSAGSAGCRGRGRMRSPPVAAPSIATGSFRHASVPTFNRCW
jgi:hypothetical protein